MVEKEEREAKEAQLWAKEEARVTTEKARLEEKAHLEEEEGELECALEEARAWVEEEAWKQEEERCAWEEEDRLAVEQDLHQEGGLSWEQAPQRWLFLPSLDSAGSPEEEERVAGPSQDKGKGGAPASEEVRGEVTGVVCDLCDKKGIPCRWGQVSTLTLFVF